MDLFGFFSRVMASGDVVAWFRVLYEVFDFMIKASSTYASTPEGAKEWQDVVDRFEIAVNNDANSETVSYSVSDTSPANETTSKGKRRFPVQE